MRSTYIFIILLNIIFISPAFCSEENPYQLEQYFLKKSDKTGNRVTRYFRTHSAILYDSNTCHDRQFYSHMTTPAHTLPGNKFAYQPFPGARFDSFILNSLSVGLWEGLEVGAVPLFYLADDEPSTNEDGSSSQHTSNFNLKWTLFSFKNFDAALAWSFFNFENVFSSPLVLPGGTYSRANIGLTWTTLILNYYFENIPLALGINYSGITLNSTSKELDDILRKQNTNSESVYDLSYILNSNWAFTLGAGRVKESAFELEKTYFGYGGSVTYIRNKKWFNQISFGVHHFTEINKDKFLLSFSI